MTALGAGLLGAPNAHADVHVERGEGASGCPDTTAFAARMLERGANDPLISVRFDHTANGYRALVVTVDGKERVLVDEAESCEGLAEATLLAVRLAFDAATSDAPFLRLGRRAAGDAEREIDQLTRSGRRSSRAMAYPYAYCGASVRQLDAIAERRKNAVAVAELLDPVDQPSR